MPKPTMSTNYRTADRNLPWDQFWANLPEGLREDVNDNTKPGDRCLTDGGSYLWCYDAGGDTEFCRYGGNDVEPMLEQIAEHFDVQILSEHDEGFFDEEEEDDEC